MNQSNPDYTFGIASLEIALLCLGFFLLGMLLCWLLRKMGVCCRQSSYTDESMAWERNENNPNTDLSWDKPRAKRKFPTPSTSGSFTADINTLLRDKTTSTTTTNVSSNSSNIASIASSIASSTIASLGNGRKDDLKKLEGIGPKIEKLLNSAGIQNFDQLAAITPDLLKSLLDAEGGQFKMHDPKTWPYQAELAAKGEWGRLKDYQNLIISGRDI